MTLHSAQRFDRRVEIWSRTIAPDPQGGFPVESFALWREVWARIMPQGVAERYVTDALRSSSSVTWEIRFAPVEATWQVRHDGKIYHVLGVVETSFGRRETVGLVTELRQ